MRPEKKFLVEEASNYIESSEFFFLTDYKGIDAEETTELRKRLSEQGAQFHVVKNSSLRIAAKDKNLGDLNDHLTGHTAIVFGGDDAAGVAKALGQYFKDSNKVPVKVGALGDRMLSAEEVKQLAKLPGLESLRAQLLALLNTSASQLLSLFSEPARGFVTVLKAKADQN
jgi:large subunit ribosomal protein L10